MTIETAVFSDIGGREHNDDTVSVLCHEGTYVYVGDGLGGYAGGRQASLAAGEKLEELAQQGSMLSPDAMRAAAEAANQAVFALQESTGGSMKTTMVFLAVEQEKAMWMHVGDSRLYHFRGGAVHTQTVDHSVSQVAALMGQITQEEIRFHEDRNRILRALGSGSARPAVSAETPLEAGDVFLLCTDGFWEYVYEAEMEQTLAKAENPQQWLEEMIVILRTRTPDNNDNYTAAAVFCK